MDLFKVYGQWDIEPVRGLDTTIWDKNGTRYTDLYGGHAVISIGHSNPHYIKVVSEQLSRLGFYSNAVQNSLQKELGRRLGKACGYDSYSLFLCNSGAEANENALKLASFHTGRSRILAFRKSFHGRTSGAVAATDNPALRSSFNSSCNVTFVPLHDTEAAERELSTRTYAGVIIEGIQGVAGIHMPDDGFLRELRHLCDKHGTVLILDEIQSGYGRTGKFFAHQFSGIRADIVTAAKGMANGFPIGGVIISPEIKPSYGLLGTTFGGNHLACTAALAVLDVMENGHLMENAARTGEYLRMAFHPGGHPDHALEEYRGRGLMIGLQVKPQYTGLRDRLLFQEHFFTGCAGTDVIRLLPPLTLSIETAGRFMDSWHRLTAEKQ